MNELEAYVEAGVVTEGDANGKRANIAVISSDNILIETSALGAYKGLKQQLEGRGKYVDYTMEVYEDMYREYVEYSGFDYDLNPERPWNLRPLGKFILAGSHAGPFGWAQHGFTGYNGGGGQRDGSFWSSLVQASTIENGGWAVFHEIGHSYDSSLLTTQESTNNLYSLLMQDKYLEDNRIVQENRWEKHFTAYHNTGIYPNDLLFLGVITYQLEQVFGDRIYGDAQRLARENKDNWLNGMNNKQRLAVGISMSLGINVLSHYEYYGIEMNERAHSLVAELPKLDVKAHYVNDKVQAKDATHFTEENVKPVLTASGSGTVTLTMSTDQPDNALLVYELYRDGEYLGVTYGNTFTDKTAQANTSHVYTVKAYDRKLNESLMSEPVTYNASEPILSTTGDLYVDIHSQFNPMKYIKATDTQGNDITSRVQVTSNTVDTSRKGIYEVTYTVQDEAGNETQLQVEVRVVAEVDYLSDLTYTFGQANGGIKKDQSHSGGMISLKGSKGEVTYTKGISAHANSSVTYNLSNKEYDYFEAYIGLDQAVRERNNASVTFEVYADGEKVYESGTVKAAQEKQLVKIPVSGVRELKLVATDAGDGNSYDHAVWADAKLYTASSAPVLTVNETFTTIAVGEDLDLTEGVTASDVEDGDLTQAVIIDNGGLNLNKSGNYTITYTVSDSEGNAATATRSVIVYSNSTYVGDLNWVSARADYSQVRKNLANGGGSIKLSLDGEEVTTFAKGLGAHANAEVIYDLSAGNYEAFETYVGVDRNIAQQNNSSIIFKVFADGEEVYSSGMMNWSTPAKFISLPVAGVSELKLVVNNGGNGNTSDHGVFADTKLLMTNSAPVLTVEGDVALKLGETLEDIYGNYSAEDAEDGDLSAEVTVAGDVNFNQPGRYVLTYTAADSDGNEVVKERTISIVDMDDYTYVSDADWASASCGWGSIRRDLSPSGNSIRLTDKNSQEVRFEKGLGTHATSTVIYDLNTVEADFFSAYVGVDRAMYNSIGSVSFEVYLDGRKVEDTGLMNSKAAMRYIEVNLAGAKELKIVATDGGNGNGSDHAVWGDAKFHFANPENVQADRSGLEAYIEKLNLLDSSRYTDESWTDFAEVKAGAEALLEAEKLTQEAVDEMLEALRAAEGTLVRVGDKMDLRAFLAQAEGLSGHPYTAQSWAALQSCIEEVKQVLYAIPAQNIIDAALESLQNAVESLELSQGKIDLRAALDSAEEFNREEYAAAPMWNELAALKVTAGELYYAVTSETEDNLIALSNKMQEVMKSLRDWKAEQMPQVDKSSLKGLLTGINGLDLRIYTKESKEGFADSAAKAEQFLNNEAATQEEVDEAAAGLHAAISRLEISNGKAELKKVLDLAATKEEADYTNEDYWGMFDYCYAHFLNIYEGDWSEQDLYIAHVYFMTVIEDLERFGK